jgi:tryptophanyl-tRNA synthetase
MASTKSSQKNSSSKVILSGIQSTGRPHLGNYLGAMKNCVDLQEKFTAYIFIADLHSLTVTRDPKKLHNDIIESALDYLAIGLDPARSVFFRQSDIPAHAELAWIFNCLASFGQMERGHAWKDALAKGHKDATVGLFTYPILMAADILLYQPDLVPVGKDQKQHIEIARDLATRFNNTYGDFFKLPEEYTPENVAQVIGTDGEDKMSKSYGNTIDLFSDESVIKKQIMGIKTDSTPVEAPKNPDTCAVFKIYSYLATSAEIANLKDKYLAGGFGYGEAKKILLAKYLEFFAPYRQKRIELAQDLGYLNDVLKAGAAKARITADQTLESVKAKIGLKI